MRTYIYDFRCYQHGHVVRKSIQVEAVGQAAGLNLARFSLSRMDGRVIERTAELIGWKIIKTPTQVDIRV